MLNLAVTAAVPTGERAGHRRTALLAALLLGASSLSALGQTSAAPVVAPTIGGMPSLSAPGAAAGEGAPTLRSAADTAPVAAGAAPVLAAPEAGAPAASVPAAGSAETSPEGAQPGSEAAPAAQSQPAAGAVAQVADADASGAAAQPAAAPETVAADPATSGVAAPETAAAEQVSPEGAQVAEAAQHEGGLPHDLSPWGMYQAADVVVKGVMIGLMVASLLTWTIFVVKIFEIFGAGRRVRRSIQTVRRAASLQDARDAAARQAGPAAFMIREAAEEYDRSYAAVAEAGGDGIKERVGSALSRIEAQAARRMQRGTGLLASIGSVAPFVGLFGTVWGIMNSFIGIAETQTTNLAVVAPGIAEALLATAIGLVAAIPAVIFYNSFARSITGYRQKLIDASAGIERLVSRDLDFRVAPRDAAGRQR